ncbi:DUF4314 domain-containing protein [Anaerococcus sp. AGMB00486]|uniref:DUF4314 domain-containing protein n=1 Tax=Anaerococcus faecalis TaxID=2742993 RepID=A0ABX2NAB9_9FIRM|nr:DUF4314 domain-containing protein [Anaerococcus faecalis]NVF11629.1 DUF4314 domain-containing protein [Anaerococcus faecalis]
MISREMIKTLREIYPVGTRVKLIQMEDEQAPPRGTLGTVIGVDDIGSIIVEWDNGSSLNVIFKVDRVKVISKKH